MEHEQRSGTTLEALTRIAPGLDTALLMARVHVAPASDDAAPFAALVERAREAARPKALYAEAFVEARGDETIRIAGLTFTSRMLRRKLEQVERVFPYVATCGHELDAVALPPGDLLAQYWWDVIKAEVLSAARAYLFAHLADRFRLGQTARMSPGSGDADVWPIEQQPLLFRLLGGVTQFIGVRLTESCLMVPNKTVSGILFPTEHDFRTCQVCHREVCPNRTAAFDAAVWHSLQES
jgi:hypothetical protein